MPPLVKLAITPPVATITLNRPERHNSLIPPLLEEYLAALETIRQREDLGALVLQAEGPSFSTGGDVLGFYQHRETLAAYSAKIVGLLNQAILEMVTSPVPVVAAVQGMVTGGALGFVLAADVVLLSPQASFTPYYCEVGFSPDGGWTAMLPDLIGHKRTAEILHRNLTITAEQAIRWGLANQLVAETSVSERAHEIALEIAGKKRGSVRHTKRLLWGSVEALSERLERERSHFIAQIMTDEALHDMAQFLKITT